MIDFMTKRSCLSEMGAARLLRSNCLTNAHPSVAPDLFFLRGSPDPALATDWR